MTREGTWTSKEGAGLTAILERFPEDRAPLQQLFLESDAFQSLCGDYGEGLAALRRWEMLTSEDASDMCNMYRVLLQELEQEVREYLKTETAAPAIHEA
jgi:hypothetical protein